MAEIVRLSDVRRRKRPIYFDRRELSQLLAVYSDRVSSGEWRDYAIDNTVGIAMFSVFRHTHDRPAYAIAKVAGPRGHEYSVFDGRCKLARAASLTEALAVFDKRIRLVDD